MKINLYKLFPSIFIILIPTKVIFGRYIFYGVGIFTIILYFGYFIRNKIKISLFEISFSIFLLVFGLGVLYTPSPKTATYVLKIMLLYFASSISAIKLIYYSYNRNAEKTFNHIVSYFIYSTIFICLYCIFKEGLSDRIGKYVFANDGTYIELSYNINMSLYFSLFKYIYSNSLKQKNLPEVILLLFLSMLSGTRKVIIGIIIYAIILIILKNKNNFIKLIPNLVKIIIFGAVLLLCIMKIDFLYNSIGYRLESLINYINNSGMDQSAEERKQMRKLAIYLFENKKMLGNGSDSFRYYYLNLRGKNLYSHCNYTELLCNLGIVGFMSYYLYHIMMIKNRLKDKNNKFANFIIAIILTCLIQDYGTISYYQIQFIFLYAFLSILALEKNHMEGK